MRRRSPPAWLPWLLLAALAAWLLWSRPAAGPAPSDAPAPPAAAGSQPAREPRAGLPAFLPPEAGATIARIRAGGPFPHPQDGGVFGNREGRLPPMPRGWYREYTVETPGLRHRGTRRIVTGGNPPRDWYYTGDHYGSFRHFDPPEAAP